MGYVSFMSMNERYTYVEMCSLWGIEIYLNMCIYVKNALRIHIESSVFMQQTDYTNVWNIFK